ncbi:hypothetical protein BDK51DRAFT_37758 [Blyttiomyces helicus]|uniref:PX domain-containing protein n=1 Tax=Blyttiomyces helicus TaxID=388810 RepID=A0A4P9W397_9FUNG|nr:hypothetical protein BDK51DRAFT_37758 [Blyttiomyces helicus]|eukprot:RKO86781.1 hypothetical protein BDK51DRAFT_37758 [Blyttiomyces helicus]
MALPATRLATHIPPPLSALCPSPPPDLEPHHPSAHDITSPQPAADSLLLIADALGRALASSAAVAVAATKTAVAVERAACVREEEREGNRAAVAVEGGAVVREQRFALLPPKVQSHSRSPPTPTSPLHQLLIPSPTRRDSASDDAASDRTVRPSARRKHTDEDEDGPLTADDLDERPGSAASSVVDEDEPRAMEGPPSNPPPMSTADHGEDSGEETRLEEDIEPPTACPIACPSDVRGDDSGEETRIEEDGEYAAATVCPIVSPADCAQVDNAKLLQTTLTAPPISVKSDMQIVSHLVFPTDSSGLPPPVEVSEYLAPHGLDELIPECDEVDEAPISPCFTASSRITPLDIDQIRARLTANVLSAVDCVASPLGAVSDEIPWLNLDRRFSRSSSRSRSRSRSRSHTRSRSLSSTRSPPRTPSPPHSPVALTPFDPPLPLPPLTDDLLASLWDSENLELAFGPRRDRDRRRRRVSALSAPPTFTDPFDPESYLGADAIRQEEDRRAADGGRRRALLGRNRRENAFSGEAGWSRVAHEPEGERGFLRLFTSATRAFFGTDHHANAIPAPPPPPPLPPLPATSPDLRRSRCATCLRYHRRRSPHRFVPRDGSESGADVEDDEEDDVIDEEDDDSRLCGSEIGDIDCVECDNADAADASVNPFGTSPTSSTSSSSPFKLRSSTTSHRHHLRLHPGRTSDPDEEQGPLRTPKKTKGWAYGVDYTDSICSEATEDATDDLADELDDDLDNEDDDDDDDHSQNDIDSENDERVPPPPAPASPPPVAPASPASPPSPPPSPPPMLMVPAPSLRLKGGIPPAFYRHGVHLSVGEPVGGGPGGRNSVERLLMDYTVYTVTVKLLRPHVPHFGNSSVVTFTVHKRYREFRSFYLALAVDELIRKKGTRLITLPRISRTDKALQRVDRRLA